MKNELKKNDFSVSLEIFPPKKEEEFLIENGFKSTSLGKRVLRVETAAIYVASVINYIYKG